MVYHRSRTTHDIQAVSVNTSTLVISHVRISDYYVGGRQSVLFALERFD